MKTKLLVEIDCLKQFCGDCEFVGDAIGFCFPEKKWYCKLFSLDSENIIKSNENGELLRCKACLEAEEKAMTELDRNRDHGLEED